MRLFISRLSGSCPTPLLGITYIFLLLYFCNVVFNVHSGYMLFRHSQKLIHNKLYSGFLHISACEAELPLKGMCRVSESKNMV